MTTYAEPLAVQKARHLLNLISADTCIDAGILLEDAGFVDLLTRHAQSTDGATAYNALIVYAESNF